MNVGELRDALSKLPETTPVLKHGEFIEEIRELDFTRVKPFNDGDGRLGYGELSDAGEWAVVL
jgi:hypothetical protein